MIERGQKIKLVAGVIMIGFIVASILSSENGNIFRAQLGQNLHQAAASAQCENLIITSQPKAPLPPYTSALIRLQTSPDNFNGLFTFSADNGTFDDLAGHRDAYIETNEKIVSFSGGEPGTILTIQDKAGNTQNCYGTLEVSDQKPALCSSLKLKPSPSPLLENQSAEIEIITSPEDFRGTYLVQADSGKFQPSTADDKTSGINTSTLVTSSKFLIYSGGKKGEKIQVKVLDENNTTCSANLIIE